MAAGKGIGRTGAYGCCTIIIITMAVLLTRRHVLRVSLFTGHSWYWATRSPDTHGHAGACVQWCTCASVSTEPVGRSVGPLRNYVMHDSVRSVVAGEKIILFSVRLFQEKINREKQIKKRSKTDIRCYTIQCPSAVHRLRGDGWCTVLCV